MYPSFDDPPFAPMLPIKEIYMTDDRTKFEKFQQRNWCVDSAISACGQGASIKRIMRYAAEFAKFCEDNPECPVVYISEYEGARKKK
jgi:hypothetical protein